MTRPKPLPHIGLISPQSEVIANTHQPAQKAGRTSLVALEDGMAALVASHSQKNLQKSMIAIVKEMVQETELSKANDITSMMRFAMVPKIDKADRPKDWLAWYSPATMYMTAWPYRLARSDFTERLITEHKEWIANDWMNGNFKVLGYACGSGVASFALAPYVSRIVGIDENQAMVGIYNEIAKRLGSASCVMQAYLGDWMPDIHSGKAPGVRKLPESEELDGFDLVVISFGVDCFEILNLSPQKRFSQLVDILEALASLLKDNGTLLIIDIEKMADQNDPSLIEMVDGHKSTGYHSDEIVNALKIMDMQDIEVLGGNRFPWEATTEEKKKWVPTEADQVLFVLKATRQE